MKRYLVFLAMNVIYVHLDNAHNPRYKVSVVPVWFVRHNPQEHMFHIGIRAGAMTHLDSFTLSVTALPSC